MQYTYHNNSPYIATVYVRIQLWALRVIEIPQGIIQTTFRNKVVIALWRKGESNIKLSIYCVTAICTYIYARIYPHRTRNPDKNEFVRDANTMSQKERAFNCGWWRKVLSFFLTPFIIRLIHTYENSRIANRDEKNKIFFALHPPPPHLVGETSTNPPRMPKWVVEVKG